MIKAKAQWLQRNYLTRLDYDARYAAEKSTFRGRVGARAYKSLISIRLSVSILTIATIDIHKL